MKAEKEAVYQMADDTAKAIVFDPEKFKAFLDTQSRLDRYSAVNALLIFKQLPEASQLKNFDDWSKDKMNDALKRSKAEVLSDEDNKELKKLYRKIVKALHPDINPDVSQAQVQLFDNAVSAYKSGDLGTLRIIGEMVGNNPLPEQHKDAMTQLVEERERLQGLLKSIRESIDNIKSEYPYTMKDILEDTEKTEQKKQELEKILEQYNELISIYKAKIEEMLR